KPAVPPGGGILGDIDSDIDDVFGRIVSDAPMATSPLAPAAATPKPASQARPQPVTPARPSPRPEPPKAPPSRADVDRIIAAAHAQLRPQVPPQAAPPPQHQPVPAAPQPAQTQPQSIFGRPIATPQPAQAEAVRSVPPQPAAPAPQFDTAGADARHQAQIAEMQQAHQQELARVENSFLETKNQLQKQVRDIQQKYQEQRSKWENVLADLRIRNDDLLRRNQELEQQVGQMTERHHQLIQEYTDLRSQTNTGQFPPQPAPLPEEIGIPQGQLIKGEFEIPAITVPVPAASSINIEPPLPEQAQAVRERTFEISAALEPAPDRIAPQASFQIPGEPPVEPPSRAEADDLLAELEALEKEMKDIGGK
ncbi:MAG: hypothetical protein QME74_10075, partial [Candidatus Edwardsbacteria bacterium]|nr:hypothetical protein [Candidatus Edwardsbacteria bacterium]